MEEVLLTFDKYVITVEHETILLGKNRVDSMQQKKSIRHFNMGTVPLELLTSYVYCAEQEKFMKADKNYLRIVSSFATALVSLTHDFRTHSVSIQIFNFAACSLLRCFLRA